MQERGCEIWIFQSSSNHLLQEPIAMFDARFSTMDDAQLAKQLCQEIDSRWRQWQIELLVLANNRNWDELKEQIKRGPTVGRKSKNGVKL
jgi:hypothetical protein